MFTRIVHIQTKGGKARELSTAVTEKVLPILRKQTGFVDEITLVSSTNPDQVLALSFWESEEYAQRYHREQFPVINEILKPLLQTNPTIETFHVDNSTTHGISKGKAA
jgi:heme-degrading monooxygenase HmoA